MEWIATSGDVEVGNLRAEMRGDGTIPIKLNSEIMVKKHLFVAAMTGSGKQLLSKLLLQVYIKLINLEFSFSMFTVNMPTQKVKEER